MEIKRSDVKEEWAHSGIVEAGGRIMRYNFPRNMIIEKPDSYVITGGHMNAGEDKKQKNYSEIISTYWMDRIQGKITENYGIKNF